MKTKLIVICILLGTLMTEAKERKAGIAFQISNPELDDIRVGWYDIDVESIDGYKLKRKSWALGAVYKYNLNANTSLRLRYGFTRFEIEEYKSDYTYEGWQDESNKGAQSKHHVAPGITWSMKNKNLEFYGGFEIPFNFHGKFTMNYNKMLRDSLRDSLMEQSIMNVIIPKGFSFGLGAIMGFTYHATSGFSIGAEFGPSLQYARLSGAVFSTRNLDYPQGQLYEYYSQDEDKGITIYQQRFSINIGLWF